MNIGKDVLSRYPVLSQRLRNISKQLEQDTLRGRCDLPITNYDIVTIILPSFDDYKQRAVFNKYVSDESDLFQAIITNKFPYDDDGLYRKTINCYNNIEEELVKLVAEDNVDRTNSGYLLSEISDYLDIGHDIYFDLITINDYYAKRLKCNFENYTKGKTLEYFNEVINTLTTIELYLYLAINCYILGIKFDYESLSLSYDQYKDYEPRIKISNDVLIEKITTYIKTKL
jgi:hypothetical protein